MKKVKILHKLNFDVTYCKLELDAIFYRIHEIKQYYVRRDLSKLYKNLDNILLEIIREQARIKFGINSLHNYNNLINKFNNYYKNLIEQLTYGLLIS
jgi:hypothetical protein